MEESKERFKNSENEKFANKRLLVAAAGMLFLAGIIAAIIYLRVSESRVYDENAEISAPEIALAPQNPGILQEIYVTEGEIIPKNFLVARVGEELIKAKEQGLIIFAAKETGKVANSNEPVVIMIDPDELRVVARIEENKGLTRIRVGQRAIFKVDAFGSKEYQGVVDEIGASSRESALDFNISSQRPTKEFNVKIRFNFGQYPELKNGMSAKVWIYR